MATDDTGGDAGVSTVAVMAMTVGVLFVGYGLLLLPRSVLSGVHVAAIGVSLALSGLFATEWAGERWDRSAATRRQLSLAFAALAVLLLVAFLVVNVATFEGNEVTTTDAG
ncbi:MAG: hypothetical protein V5A23_09165 [Halobacteriales archaeon]